MNQFKFFQVLGTALTLAIIGACNDLDSDDSKSGGSLTITETITDAPPINIANVRSYSVSGTCVGGQGGQNSVVEVVLGLNRLGSPACEDGEWEVSAHDVSLVGDSDSLKLTVTEGQEEVSQTLIKDTAKPEVTLGTPAIINSINQNSYSVSGTCSEVGQDVVVNIGGLEKSVNCTGDGWSLGGYNVSSLATASVALSVNMNDAVGNPADEVSVSVDRDVDSPTVRITTTNFKVNSTNKTNYPLRGTCSENGRNVVLKIAGLSDKTFSCLSSGWSFAEDVSGIEEVSGIELSVEQEDAAGNKGVATATLEKDTVLPVLATNAGQVVNSSNVANFKLKGTCSEQGQNVIVTISELNPLPSTNPLTSSCDGTSWEATLPSDAGEGTATVSLTQDDSFRNRGTATGTFIKDTATSDPVFHTSLDITGANFTNYIIRGTCPESGTVSLTIPLQQAPVSISCVGESWTHAAINTTSWTDDTNHNLSATLTDTAGNTGAPVSKTVSKNTSALAVSINPPTPIKNANKGSYAVSGGCSTHTGTLAVTVGGQPPATQPSCASRTWATTVDVSSVTDGNAVSISVSFTTSGGDTVSADRRVLKDISPPTLTISTLSAINFINQSSYSVSGTCPGADQSIQVAIEGLNFSTNCLSNNWTLESKDVSSLTTSLIAITADTTDVAGNAAAQASASVGRDIIAPVLTITTSDLNINAANVGSYTLTGGCEGTTEVTITIGDLSAVTETCSDASWTLPSKDMSDLGDGKDIVVLIAQDDAAGNRGRLRSGLDKDIIVPNVTMTSSLLVSSSNVATYPMAGACDENGTGVVSITIARGTATSVNCRGRNWQKNVNLGTESDGNISVSIVHQDDLGNGTTITPTLKKDTVAPTLTIASPTMMNSVNQNAYTIRGTCSEEGAQITVRIAGQSNSLSFDCASSTWQVSGNFTSLVDNTQIGITAFIQDGHGNRSIQTASFAKDATLPKVTINTLTELTDTNQTAFPLTGSCNQNNSDVVVSGNNIIAPSTQPTCQGGEWTTNIDFSTLISTFKGDITIRAYQVDAAGNRRNAPVKIIPGEGKTFLHSKIASGFDHSCALNSGGGVKCWGWQLYGRLGNNSVVENDILYPLDVVGRDTDNDNSGDGILGSIVQVSAGETHTCALNSSGNVLCWGQGTSGRLGNNATMNSSFPVQVVGPDINNDNSGDGILGNIVQIGVGDYYACALNSSSNVLCWGFNGFGQLGDNSRNNRSYPVFVVQSEGSTAPLNRVVQLSVGRSHVCTLTSAETVLCWGWGVYGQLGSSTETFSYPLWDARFGVIRDAPLPVLTQEGGPPLSGIAQVASGNINTCALTLDGHVKCWGYGRLGALGDNGGVSADQSWFPVDVVGEDTSGNGSGDGLLSNIVKITLGNKHACALNSQDKVSCWGYGGYGKLGNGSRDNKNYPVSVIAGSGSSSSLSGIIEIDSFYDVTCALSEEGRVLCWGKGQNGLLGYGGTAHQFSPVTVIPASGSTDFLNIGTYRGSYTCRGGACAFDPIGPSLVGTSSSPSTSDSPSIEVSGIETGKILNLYSSADCSTRPEGTASSPGATIALSSLSEGAYKYYFDITDGPKNRSDCSKSFISYIYDNTAPSTPTLSFDPASDTDTTPDISVSGITPGDLVRVYSESACSTLAAPATRVDGVSRDITLNEISGVAAHNFYATATDAAGNVSNCSAAATYTLEGL